MILLPEKIAGDSIRKLSKGVVLIWENYQFEDGSKKTSRFVILTDCRNDMFLAIRPTGRVDFYERPTNIHREFIKILANDDPLFSKPTIFDLNSIYPLSTTEMKKLFGEQIKCPHKISDDVLNRLEEMIRNSITLRRDWIDWILSSKK